MHGLQDGSTILSGWGDGKIRGFGPQSGKLLFTINDAHQKAVTAIASTGDSSRIISGGEEGMVRVWRLGRTSQVREGGEGARTGPHAAVRWACNKQELVCRSIPRLYLLRCNFASREAN